MSLAKSIQTRPVGKLPGRRVVKLGAGNRAVIIAGHNQHLSARQQMCRMQDPGRVQASGDGKLSGRRIVNLRATQVAPASAVALSCRHQHGAVTRHGCGVAGACRVQAAGEREGPTRGS